MNEELVLAVAEAMRDSGAKNMRGLARAALLYLNDSVVGEVTGNTVCQHCVKETEFILRRRIV